MSTLSVRTWILLSIIPLSVLLQGCDDDSDDNTGGGGGSGHDSCPRDGTAVAEGKECFCSKGAEVGDVQMDDNICTTVTSAPLTAPATQAPQKADEGKFCWNSDGKCHNAAEPAACQMGWSLETLGDNYAASGCLCGSTVCAAGTVCKLAIAGTYSCAANTTVLPKPVLYDSGSQNMYAAGADKSAGVTAGASGTVTGWYVYAPGADYVCVYGRTAGAGDAAANCGTTPFDDTKCAGTGTAIVATRHLLSPFFKIATTAVANGFPNNAGGDTLEIASCHNGVASGMAKGYYIGS